MKAGTVIVPLASLVMTKILLRTSLLSKGCKWFRFDLLTCSCSK